MNITIENPSPGFVESILLMSLLISLTALSIDTMLPALPEIGRELGVKYTNDVQLIISMLILGLSVGQLVFGPLSDSMGRKPVLFAGVMIFIFGCVLCFFSSAFMVMLIGRIVQGIGAAGPRSIVLALIRDQYEGRSMARMMSSIMSVFIMIPAVAPSIGQGIIMVASWRKKTAISFAVIFFFFCCEKSELCFLILSGVMPCLRRSALNVSPLG